MPSDLESASTNLSEQTKKLQIALHYTAGDEEKAKKMLSGSYSDIFVIKGRFSSSSVYGAFLLFLKIESLTILNSFYIVTRSFEIADVKTNQDWRNFEKQLVEISNKDGFEDSMTASMKDGVTKALTLQELTSFLRLVEQDDSISVNRNFQKCISEVTGFKNVKLSVDYEKINSISMELNSLTSRKIADVEPVKIQKPDPDTIKIEKLDNPLEGIEVKLILNGALILSPIKGKDISELVPGDRIMISIIDKSPKVTNVLQAFKAYREDGSPKPIPGRIVSVKHAEGYKIFAIVAKGIYIKIEEEEDFIKVGMDPTYYNNQSSTEDADNKKNKIVMYILAGVFVALLATIVVFVFAI